MGAMKKGKTQKIASWSHKTVFVCNKYISEQMNRVTCNKTHKNN